VLRKVNPTVVSFLRFLWRWFMINDEVEQPLRCNGITSLIGSIHS
jgi:hypothetical protein